VPVISLSPVRGSGFQAVSLFSSGVLFSAKQYSFPEIIFLKNKCKLLSNR